MDKEERMDPAAQELKEETMTAEPMDEETRRAMGILEEPVPIEDEEEEVFPQEPALIEVSYVLTEEDVYKRQVSFSFANFPHFSHPLLLLLSNKSLLPF